MVTLITLIHERTTNTLLGISLTLDSSLWWARTSLTRASFANVSDTLRLIGASWTSQTWTAWPVVPSTSWWRRPRWTRWWRGSGRRGRSRRRVLPLWLRRWRKRQEFLGQKEADFFQLPSLNLISGPYLKKSLFINSFFYSNVLVLY